jgi:hypothetical protein
MAGYAFGPGWSGRWVPGCRRRLMVRPGSGLPEEPVLGVQAGRAGHRAVPRLPSRALHTRGRAPGIGPQPGEDGIADLAFQCAHGFFGSLAFSEFLVVAGTSPGVPVAELGDRGHVDRVVEAAVPAPAQPVDLALAGGDLVCREKRDG